MDETFVVVMVTCTSKKEARNIADKLLKTRMVACANIFGGLESYFWWEGRINSAKEVLVMMKTKRSNFKKIKDEIKKLHSYEVPEIIAIPIIAGSEEYLRWIKDSIRG